MSNNQWTRLIRQPNRYRSIARANSNAAVSVLVCKRAGLIVARFRRRPIWDGARTIVAVASIVVITAIIILVICA